jgi:hypothetical protein
LFTESVEAGDVLRILEKEPRLRTLALNRVQRRTRQGYRDAIIELRRDPERGFAKLAAMGAVREIPAASRRSHSPRGEPPSTVMRAPDLIRSVRYMIE